MPKDLMKEKKDTEELLSHLEDEYRKAGVSEKTYNELKQKYTEKIEKLNKKIGPKKSESKEKTKEKAAEPEKPKEENMDEKIKREREEEEREKEKLRQEVEKQQKEEAEEIKKAETENKGKGTGMIGKLFGRGKKEEKPEQVAETDASEEETSEETPTSSIEVEKLKVMIESMREAKNATDSLIQNVSESLGELRSMVFQSDALIKEMETKLEKVDDEISEVRPKEISKKMRETKDTLERYDTTLEKLTKKSEDLSEKINHVYDILKGIGGIENLVDMSKDIQTKFEDIKEAVKYIERLSLKTEKIFIDLNKSLEDFTTYKIKQDGIEDSVKELTTSVDNLGVRLEGYTEKRDIEALKKEILLMKKGVEEVTKVLPMVKVRIPGRISDMIKERDDILLFLESLEEQLKSGKISFGEYDEIKKENNNKLEQLENKLKGEWDKVLKFAESAPQEKPAAPKEEPSEAEKAEVEPAKEEEKEKPEKEETVPKEAVEEKLKPEEKKPKEEGREEQKPEEKEPEKKEVEQKEKPAEKEGPIEKEEKKEEPKKDSEEEELKKEIKKEAEKIDKKFEKKDKKKKKGVLNVIKDLKDKM